MSKVEQHQKAGAAAAPKNKRFAERFAKNAEANWVALMTHEASSDYANSEAARIDACGISYPPPLVPSEYKDTTGVTHYTLVLGIRRTHVDIKSIYDQSDILLVQRAQDSHIFPGHWNLPGGMVGVPFERVLAAAQREFTEETGFSCQCPQKCGTMLITRGPQTIAVHCVTVFVPSHTTMPDRPAEMRAHWWKWSDIKSGNVAPLPRNLRVLIPLMFRGVDNWILYYPYETFPQWDKEHSILKPEDVLLENPPGHAILCF